jgi:UDP-hydrolysing UDP-N-acetyl-D-glucosamine 2-epimerase
VTAVEAVDQRDHRMATKRRVCVVITARPSYSRIRTALSAIKERADLELQLVVAGSALLDRYGTAVDYIEQDGFHVGARVFMVLEGENLTSMAKTTGLGMLELATALDNLEPDVVVTIADRYETMATAVAAAYMNIPVAHVQGGEVTGSIDEKVRHAVTKLSDVHFVSTSLAAERVIRMGEDPKRVHVTGCPSIDLAAEVLANPGLDYDPFVRYGGVGEWLDLRADKRYLVVMQHPVTTEYRLARQHVEETLNAVAEVGLPTLWFWPNVDAGSDGTSKGIRAFRERRHPENIHFFKNMAPTDFLRLLLHSGGIVGNSSVAIREGAFLGVPAVNIGSRQAGRERGRNVIDVSYDREQIVEAIQTHLGNGRYPSDPLYGDGDAGRRIAALLAEAEYTIEKRLTY